MNDNIFLDTNILIYCYTETELDKQEIATELAQNPNAWVSTQVLQETANTLYKKFHRTWSDIDTVIEEVCQNFEVFHNSPNTIRRALTIANSHGFSLYDSLILSSALEANCKIVYSEDMQHGRVIDGKMKIINPFLKK